MAPKFPGWHSFLLSGKIGALLRLPCARGWGWGWRRRLTRRERAQSPFTDGWHDRAHCVPSPTSLPRAVWFPIRFSRSGLAVWAQTPGAVLGKSWPKGFPWRSSQLGADLHGPRTRKPVSGGPSQVSSLSGFPFVPRSRTLELSYARQSGGGSAQILRTNSLQDT